MKKCLLALTLIMALIISGCSSNSADTSDNNSEKVIKIRAAGAMPPKQGYMVGYHVPWMERVKQESGGRVDFDVYPSAELVPMGGELTALESKQIDMALSGMRTYHPDLFPMADIASLPVLKTDALTTTKAYLKLFDSDVKLQGDKTYYDLNIADHGYVALPMPALDNYIISTYKKEIKNPEDFKGLILRGSTRSHEIFAGKLGATPVTMVSTEIYDAMTRGTIDGIIFSIADWQGYGFQDVAKYNIRGLTLGTFTGENIFLKETWESFPEDIREIMYTAAREQAIEGAKYWMSLVDPTIELAKGMGSTFVDFTELPIETQNLINKAIVETWYGWIDKVTAEGMPGLEAARLWRDCMVEAGAVVPEELMSL